MVIAGANRACWSADWGRGLSYSPYFTLPNAATVRGQKTFPEDNDDASDDASDSGPDSDWNRPSKTQLKKESHDLQELGEALVAMPDDRLVGLGTDEFLHDAISQSHR